MKMHCLVNKVSTKYNDEMCLNHMMSYSITRDFRENLIFAIFADDQKTQKYVYAKNCTFKESF